MKTRTDPQPASLLLVHGAGSTPHIFDGWSQHFPGLVVHAVDLQNGLDISWASMADYARAVVNVAAQLPKPVALCGWSMGGLVALQASVILGDVLHSLILIEPSPPAEIQGFKPDTSVMSSTFDPEAVYGRFPTGQPVRFESALARLERKRGISIPRVPCRVLVISGREFPQDRGHAVAQLYGAEHDAFTDLDHWGLVLDPRVPRRIAAFLLWPAGNASLTDT